MPLSVDSYKTTVLTPGVRRSGMTFQGWDDEPEGKQVGLFDSVSDLLAVSLSWEERARRSGRTMKSNYHPNQ